MKKLLMLSLLSSFCISLSSQNEILFSTRVLPFYIESNDTLLKNMAIWAINENSIDFIPHETIDFFNGKKTWELKAIDNLMAENRFSISKINLQLADIQLINMKKNISRKKLVFMGMGIGLGVGFMTGLILKDEVIHCEFEPGFCEFGKLIFTLGTSLGGLGLGTATGALIPINQVKLSIPFNGSKSTIRKNKKKLKRYSIL